MIKIGWKAGSEQYPPSDLLEYAIAAERAGFDLLEASDHFHPWDERGQASFVWTWLGAVAGRTHRIHIGTGLTCPILRYHPAIIAQAAATVSALAGGRTFLCVGTGEALNEYPATALWPDYGERQERLGEAVDLIRALWTGKRISHSGVYYRTREAKLYTLSPAPIPIYVSSLVPDSAGFAGRYGDGLITIGGKKPHVYRQLLANFDAGAQDAGKDPSTMPRMIEVLVAYTEDETGAIACVRKYWAGCFIPALFNERIYTPRMAAENGEAVGNDTIKRRMCLSGDPDDHIKFLAQYVDLGFDQLVVHSAGPDQHAFIESYGREVIPHLREEGKMP
jgi:coenzyme F420-dependent glucose-6-phosphate dehydrogenase